ncbi:beta-ketoacyl synthase chain length factor [Micromonospora peucetia]|uniref:beta-ketoacyl synthase chain length factor n=1 Tax=Micromonospora peucetia TaxID=47871 RepID=UPI00225BEA8F|nr:beta-ketoacyl synthase chain length factor [Micromonospora peucetia]MCX4390679.1 beta-ketoacyl synthase chain length factor [Micromonospora peucetia]
MSAGGGPTDTRPEGSATHGRLTVLAEAAWPEPGDGAPPRVPGYLHSSFPPLVAAVAERCLTRAYGRRPAPDGERIAVVLVSAAGDRASAAHVRATVAGGGRPGPLFFFQSVPNSVAGHVAARWGLGGPVLCLAPTGDPRAEGTAEAELLLHDGDADRALLVLIEQAPDDGGARGPGGVPGTRAVAVLLGGDAP